MQGYVFCEILKVIEEGTFEQLIGLIRRDRFNVVLRRRAFGYSNEAYYYDMLLH